MYIQTPISKADFLNNGHKQKKMAFHYLFNKSGLSHKMEHLTCAKVCEAF